MKLEDLPTVKVMAGNRAQLKWHLDHVMTGQGTLKLWIGSVSMDDAMIALIKPVIVRELSARIMEIGKELEQLGVDLG